MRDSDRVAKTTPVIPRTDQLERDGKISLTREIGDIRIFEPVANDVDLVLLQLQLSKGERLTLDTNAAFAGLSSLDTVLRVFDARGSELA